MGWWHVKDPLTSSIFLSWFDVASLFAKFKKGGVDKTFEICRPLGLL